MPTPGSSSRATRAAFETVEHWRIGTASSTGARPAESPVSKSPIKIEREDGSDAPFASEEVEAARIMYDAFRATKGPDGELIDTQDWSAATEARVEVRRPTSAFAHHPFPLESGPSPHAQFTPRRANLPLPTPNADADHPATTLLPGSLFDVTTLVYGVPNLSLYTTVSPTLTLKSLAILTIG